MVEYQLLKIEIRMEDKIFGALSFRFGWIKEETITIWDQAFRVRIRTSSRKDEKPTQTQQNAYLDNIQFLVHGNIN